MASIAAATARPSASAGPIAPKDTATAAAIILNGADQEFDPHERNRHQQPGEGEDDADDEGAAHDVSEQAHDERECAREGLHNVERDHDESGLREGLQIPDKPAGPDAKIDHGEEHDEGERRIGFDAGRGRLDARDQR
jgi:hypothetical protein